MASITTGQQESTTFEVTGIERVAEDNRKHTQLWDTMWLWWSANAVVATVALGTLSAFAGLGFWGSVLVIIIFNVLGVLPVAFLSTLGPKTGLAQMPLSRFAFGLQGARLPAIFNALACIGWSAVNALIGSQIIVTWSAGAIPQWAALLFLAVVTTAVSVFGYFIVHRYERFAWILMFILFGYVFFASSGKFTFDNIGAGALGGGLLLFSAIVTFGGAIFGYAVGWSSYAADYTRRQPASTPSNRVFWYAFFGVIVPCILLEILGVLLASAVPGDIFNNAPAGKVIADAIGTGGIGSLVIVLLAFSTIANNVPNDYSFALSTQVLGLKNIKRWILTIIGAVAYVALALALQANFNFKLEGFLLVIAYWLGAWNAVVLLEHFVFRKGKYPVEDYENASKLPVGIAGVAAMVIGIAVALLGVQQIATFNYEGIISKQIADADIGFPLAIVVAGILYFFLRRWELSKYQR
jgi:NCS1 nucleoside transporter family